VNESRSLERRDGEGIRGSDRAHGVKSRLSTAKKDVSLGSKSCESCVSTVLTASNID
jgi:hypothetical protein